MQKIISYPISFIAIILFLLTLVIFHPIQWICLNVFGYQAHKKSVDYLNFILLRIGHVLGTNYKVTNRESIPKGVPIIFYFNGVHADYHRPTDTPDKIKYDLMEKRARLVFYTAMEMANREEMLKRDIPLDSQRAF